MEDSQLTLNFLDPGVVYEHGLGKTTTLSGQLAFGFAARDCSGCDFEFRIFPFLIVKNRNNVNFERRLRKGKSIERNTENYWGSVALYQDTTLFGNLDFDSSFFVGGVYGLQRTGKKGFQFRFEFGPVYYLTVSDNDDLGIWVNLRMGFVLGKKR